MPPPPEASAAAPRLPAAALTLRPHPRETVPTGTTVHAMVAAAGSPQGPGWLFEYLIADAAAALQVPPATAPGPADGLWQHTCLEAFVQDGEGPGYTEFNFSPSGQWAVYRFAAQRQRLPGDRPPDEGPDIECSPVAGGWRLLAWVPCALLPRRPGAIGLNAVLETREATLSHWALHHPHADRPDFHHPGAWVHQPGLPPCPDTRPPDETRS